MKEFKFLTNIYDPNKEDAFWTVLRSWDETQEQAWSHHLYWLKDKILGRPQESDFYTTEQLESMGMVGVYVLE